MSDRLNSRQPYEPHKMTPRDLAVFRARKVDGLSLKETAKKLGISKDLVVRAQRKPAYNQMAINALELNEMSIDAATKLLIDQTRAERTVFSNGSRITEADNSVRMAAVKELMSIFGAYAPKDINVNHEFSTASEAELLGEISMACERIGVVDVETIAPGESYPGDIHEESGDDEAPVEHNEEDSRESSSTVEEYRMGGAEQGNDTGSIKES